MAGPVLHVRYVNHSNGVVKEWRKFWSNNFLVDCTLAAEGQYIKAHRLILSACSPYFEMLFSEEREKHPFVVLFGASFDTLKALLDFVYNGETQIPEENTKTFLLLAEFLQIKGLTNRTESNNENSCPNVIENSPQCLSSYNQGTCDVTPQDLHTLPVKPELLNSEFEETNIVLKSVEGCRHVESAPVITAQQPEQEERQQLQQWHPLHQQQHQQHEKQLHQEQHLNELPCEASSGPDVAKKQELEVCLRPNIEEMDGSESEESVPTKDMSQEDRSEMNDGVENLNPSSSAAEAFAADPLPRLRPLNQKRSVPHVQLSRSSTRCDSTRGTSLVHRKKTQMSRRPHTCDICGITFKFYQSFKDHKLKHTDERPFTCDSCGFSFRRFFDLKRHKRIHTGERPFTCDVCGVSFTQLNNLKTHQRIHTGERPFTCDVCGASFIQRSGLNAHKHRHGIFPPIK